LVSAKRRILVLDGHPDPAGERFVHQLADAYANAAKQAGHEVLRFRLADLNVPLITSKEDYRLDPPEQLRACLDAIDWAQHVVILHPLWLGTMPAALKALLEQLVRPGFAFSTAQLGQWPVKFWRGKTARVAITMGMPRLAYWWFFGGGGARNVQRFILKSCGFGRVRTTLIGGAETLSAAQRSAWLESLAAFGREAR
jgi:putative NADPH-quinone reductase